MMRCCCIGHVLDDTRVPRRSRISTLRSGVSPAASVSTTTSSDGCVLVLPELNSGGRFDCKAKAGSGRDRSWTSEERTAMCVC